MILLDCLNTVQEAGLQKHQMLFPQRQDRESSGTLFSDPSCPITGETKASWGEMGVSKHLGDGAVLRFQQEPLTEVTGALLWTPKFPLHQVP